MSGSASLLTHRLGARALAWSESGHLAQAAETASAAEAAAQRLGFGQQYFAWDHLRALAGLARERGELDTAEQLTEQALSISEQGRPIFEFLALLGRAEIWAARGRVRDALASIEGARRVLPGAGPALQATAAAPAHAARHAQRVESTVDAHACGCSPQVIDIRANVSRRAFNARPCNCPVSRVGQ